MSFSFTNFLRGGKISNGDNLIERYDANVANYYVIVAIWLFDHYKLRSFQEKSTSNQSLDLNTINYTFF